MHCTRFFFTEPAWWKVCLLNTFLQILYYYSAKIMNSVAALSSCERIFWCNSFILVSHFYIHLQKFWCLFFQYWKYALNSIYPWLQHLNLGSIDSLICLFRKYFYRSWCLIYHAIFWAKLQIYYLDIYSLWSLESSNLYFRKPALIKMLSGAQVIPTQLKIWTGLHVMKNSTIRLN